MNGIQVTNFHNQVDWTLELSNLRTASSSKQDDQSFIRI